MTASRSRIPELDGLRAIACFLVLWSHVWHRDFKAPSILQAGSTGVDLFFVLSGFLITRILIYNREHGIGLWAFWKRRAARIFPCAYFGLLLAAAVRPEWQMIYSALYIQNYAAILDLVHHSVSGHYWTLSVEEQFYLFIPLLVLMAPVPKSRSYVDCALVVCLASMLFVLWIMGGEPRLTAAKAITLGATTRGWPLIAGAILAFREQEVRSSIWPAVLLAAALFVLAYSGIFYRLFLVFAYVVGGNIDASAVAAAMLNRQFVIVGLFALCLCPAATKVTLLRDVSLGFLGARSYGIYVYHYPIFIVLGVLGGQAGPAGIITAVALTLAVACLSYRYIEQPCLQRFRYLTPAPV